MLSRSTRLRGKATQNSRSPARSRTQNSPGEPWRTNTSASSPKSALMRSRNMRMPGRSPARRPGISPRAGKTRMPSFSASRSRNSRSAPGGSELSAAWMVFRWLTKLPMANPMRGCCTCCRKSRNEAPCEATSATTSTARVRQKKEPAHHFICAASRRG